MKRELMFVKLKMAMGLQKIGAVKNSKILQVNNKNRIEKKVKIQTHLLLTRTSNNSFFNFSNCFLSWNSVETSLSVMRDPSK